MADRQDIIPAGREQDHEVMHYSPAVRVGDFVFISGVLGSRPDRTFDPDPLRQYQQAFANLEHVLRAAGCVVSDLVELTTFHVGLREHMALLPATNVATMGGPPYPAMTTIGVVELGYPEAIIEIRGIAHRTG